MDSSLEGTLVSASPGSPPFSTIAGTAIAGTAFYKFPDRCYFVVPPSLSVSMPAFGSGAEVFRVQSPGLVGIIGPLNDRSPVGEKGQVIAVDMGLEHELVLLNRLVGYRL